MSRLIENISDTAKWVAIFRAEESERPDAIFHDPFARELAGKKGEEIANSVQFSRQNSWTFVARTYLFDTLILQHLDQGGDMIVNLAAGLDTRAYRLPLRKELKWVDVDLPGILNYRDEILKPEKPRCDHLSIHLDLADGDKRKKLFRQLNEQCSKALIVAEGLMTYLTYEQVAGLAIDLSSQLHFCRWVFDLQSPALLEMAKEKMGASLKGSGAAFQFAPENGEDFFLQYGWNNIESYSKFKTAAKLDRLPDELKPYADMPEPPGPHRNFVWSGVCLFENVAS